MRRALVGLALALALVAACTGGGDDDDDVAPTTSTDPSATTTTVDFSGVSLPSVRGSTTTTTVGLAGGRATLGGTVNGPDGPAGGAVVRVERFVGDRVAASDVPVHLDGTWRAEGILGGRYRVRAWRVPDLAMPEPQIFFLQGTEKKALHLRLEEVGGFKAKASIAPDPPVVDRQAELRVLVTFTEVDANGVVRGQPQAGASATLVGSGRWQVDTVNPVRADASGVARWLLRCRDEGDQPLSVLVDTAQGGASVALELPACVFVRATTTTAAPPASTTTSSTTTTTTEP
jgi:hypothetical protein